MKSQLDDNVLIDRFLAGDTKAFNLLVEKYKRKIYLTVYRLLGNHEDASDITQEVIIKMYNELKNFRRESSIYTWIYRIATNLSLNELKRRKIRSFFDFDEVEEWLFKDEKQSPELSFRENELSNKIQEAINKLPEKQRTVFTLRYYDGLSYEEISEILGTSVGALKANYFHAINKLQKELKDVL
ncbi:MAG: sigma-70 family RNA polymerase sigma factor [Ignavibacteria bacterium]|jgi:RNA polymerase sigma-70 factor (ECF subfamily)|nr:sigma-70 family RNA polymerase sigma factor [Ignavibacteria bacterium]MDH7526618.1 sigma-70 family RNA polymerase sigma factor [Ignavibacteria bacterium]